MAIVSLRHQHVHVRDEDTRRNVLDGPPRSQLPHRIVDRTTPGKLEEKKCLMDFWNSTNGKYWSDAKENNWGVGDHCTNNWMGVECSDGQVVTIDIVDNNQTGELSESLGGLGALDRFNLRTGGIGGVLPASLVKLTNITYLTIYAHDIGGPLPASFDSFAKIKTLQFIGMPLNGEIPALHLPVVKTISIYENQLTGPIPSLDQVPKIEKLSLGGQHLQGTIPSLHNVPELNWLSLHDNQLTGPIPSLDQVPKLERLGLSSNNLSGHLPSFSDLPVLTEVYLNDNNFSGPLPISNFAKHPGLILFIAHNNNFDGDLSSTIFDLQNSRRSSFQETKNSPAHFHQS